MEFHERLARIMRNKGISQSELCRRSGIATSAMSHYVRGETEPSFTKVIAIARALDIPVDDLADNAFGSMPRMTPEDTELLSLFHSMSAQGRANLIEQAEFLAARHPLNQALGVGA